MEVSRPSVCRQCTLDAHIDASLCRRILMSSFVAILHLRGCPRSWRSDTCVGALDRGDRASATCMDWLDRLPDGIASCPIVCRSTRVRRTSMCPIRHTLMYSFGAIRHWVPWICASIRHKVPWIRVSRVGSYGTPNGRQRQMLGFPAPVSSHGSQWCGACGVARAHTRGMRVGHAASCCTHFGSC